MIKKDRKLVKLSSSKLCIECCKPYKETPSVVSGMCQKCYYMTNAERIQLEKDELRKEQARLAAIDNLARRKAEAERRRFAELSKEERIQEVAERLRKLQSPQTEKPKRKPRQKKSSPQPYEPKLGSVPRPEGEARKSTYDRDFYGPIPSGRKAEQRLRPVKIHGRTLFLDERVKVESDYFLNLTLRCWQRKKRFQVTIKVLVTYGNSFETVRFFNLLVLQDPRCTSFLLERVHLLDFVNETVRKKTENFLRALI